MTDQDVSSYEDRIVELVRQAIEAAFAEGRAGARLYILRELREMGLDTAANEIEGKE